METLFHTTSVLSATAVSALFSAAWEGIILAACVAVFLRLLPGLSAAARSIVWLNVFLLIALLHVLPSLRLSSGSGSGSFIGSGAGHPPVQLDLRWSLGLAAVWGLLSLWRAVQLISSAVRLHRLVKRATPIEPDPVLLPLLQNRAAGGYIIRAAELCISDEVERPSVSGFFRPRILIPPTLLAELSESELQQVVIHEMEHLRRGDDWINLLQKICLVFFPVNPALLWVERRLCAERELACDDSVLRSSCGRKAYALCLTHLAEHSMLRRSFSLVLGAWERQSEVVRRVHRILRRPVQLMSARQGKLVTAGLVIAVLGGAAELARTPELIGFAPAAHPVSLASSKQPASQREIDFSQPKPRVSEPTAQLVKAVMPESAPQSAPQSAKPKKTLRTAAVRRIARPDFVEEQQTFVVLTEWTDNGIPPHIPPHVVFAVSPDNRIAYAAVPVANGWLIVQI
jgi:beta-lactamase regulating signal transducer with metallopeptidase domain